MPVDSIARRDVAAIILAVTREHGSSVAHHVRAKLSSFYVWAMSMGLAETNPVLGTPKPELSAGRERVLDDDELAAVWKACGDNDTGRIVKLLALTGARRSEVGGMCWSELDRLRGTWTLPAARSKNKRNHTLTLPSEAWAIVDPVSTQDGRDQLFGDRSAVGFASWGPAKKTLDDKLGCESASLGLARLAPNCSNAHGRYRNSAAHHRSRAQSCFRSSSGCGWYLQSRDIRAGNH